MRNGNAMSEQQFCTIYFLDMLIGIIWYKALMFRCIRYCSSAVSIGIFVGLLLIFVITGICTDIKKGRNWQNILMNLILGFGSYTILAYFDFRHDLIMVEFKVALVLAGVYAAYTMTGRIRNKRKKSRILRSRCRKACRGTKLIFCAGMVLLMLVVTYCNIFGTGLIRSGVRPSYISDGGEQTMDNNRDAIMLMEQSVWKRLSDSEKLDVLQSVANIESSYLGIPHGLTVCAKDGRKDELGSYDDSMHQINIAPETLRTADSETACNVIAHESWHCFQHRMLDVYNNTSNELKNLILFEGAADIEAEFMDYVDGNENYWAYRSQLCEVQARDYAESRTAMYFEFIENSSDDCH